MHSDPIATWHLTRDFSYANLFVLNLPTHGLLNGSLGEIHDVSVVVSDPIRVAATTVEQREYGVYTNMVTWKLAGY
jgi:hypothetical protein